MDEWLICVFVASPWAITLVSQAQFWPEFNWSKAVKGNAKGLLSFIISDWFEPGIGPAKGKNASDCRNATEIFLEVLYQVDMTYPNLIDVSNIHSWFIDEDVIFGNNYPTRNLEPLMMNNLGSWWNRPDGPSTKLYNLFICGDYIKTNYQLASAEGANESGKYAANAILSASN